MTIWLVALNTIGLVVIAGLSLFILSRGFGRGHEYDGYDDE